MLQQFDREIFDGVGVEVFRDVVAVKRDGYIFHHFGRSRIVVRHFLSGRIRTRKLNVKLNAQVRYVGVVDETNVS